MRRLILIATFVLAGLAALPAGDALLSTATTEGSVELSLRDGRGLAVISRRGTVLGRLRRGRIVATRNVFVANWSSKRKISDNLVAYRGRRMTLRVFSGDGRWRIRLRGRAVNVSAVVRGSLTLDGANSGETGLYSIDGGPVRAWPRTRQNFSLED
jgi:hypothetical protein